VKKKKKEKGEKTLKTTSRARVEGKQLVFSRSTLRLEQTLPIPCDALFISPSSYFFH